MLSHEDWLTERRTGIGGSDAASVFNVGYGCRRRLAYDKRNIPPDFPFDETLPIQLGNLLEPFFAGQYGLKTGRLLSQSKSRVHPTIPAARVNPDRLIFKSEAPLSQFLETALLPKDTGVLEIKAQGAAVYSKTKREGLSDQYILQQQHALFVTGAEWGSFQIGNRDSGHSTHWDVTRNAELQRDLEKEIPAMWSLIQSDAPLPDRLPVDDFRCSECQWRRSCQGDSLVHVSGKSDLVVAEDIRPLLAQYDVRKPLFDEANALLDETKEALRTALVERPAVRVGWGDADRKVYYRGQDGRITWQGEELAKKYGKLRDEVKSRLPGDAVVGFDEEFPPAASFMRQGAPFRRLSIY